MTMRTTDRTIIKADPGWYLVQFDPGYFIDGKQEPACIMLEPIIAWQIEREEEEHPSGALLTNGRSFVSVTPITTEGAVEDRVRPWAFKRPDGKYDIQGNCEFDTEAELRAYWQATENKRSTAAE
jgi:hypothetical protein